MQQAHARILHQTAAAPNRGSNAFFRGTREQDLCKGVFLINQSRKEYSDHQTERSADPRCIENTLCLPLRMQRAAHEDSRSRRTHCSNAQSLARQNIRMQTRGTESSSSAQPVAELQGGRVLAVRST